MNARTIIRKYRLHHLLFWVLLLAGWHFFRYQDYPPRVAWWISIVKVADLALLVYITNYVLIPRILYRKHYVAFGVIFLLMIVSSSIGKMYLEGWLMKSTTMLQVFVHFKSRVYDNVLPHILLVSTGAAFKLLIDQVRAQRRLAQLAAEKSAAELNFLKMQINPHFLFNSLNSIYFLIDKENADARSTLLRFSDLLRYQLYECNADRIDIEKEISYLRDYINLQKMRKDKHYEASFQVGSGVGGFQITPLLLISFVENAFKHISHHPYGENFVRVSADRADGVFHFIVENSKDDRVRANDPAGGIGLPNVKRRLELLYPYRHELRVQNNSSTFKVDLKLRIHDDALPDHR